MKTILAITSMVLISCVYNKEFERGFVYDSTITEENYKKTPCFVDGQTVRPKKKKN